MHMYVIWRDGHKDPTCLHPYISKRDRDGKNRLLDSVERAMVG